MANIRARFSLFLSFSFFFFFFSFFFFFIFFFFFYSSLPLSLSLSLFSFLRLVLLYSFLVFLFLPAVAIFSRVYVQTVYASTRRGYTSALKIFARAVFSRRCEIARVLYRFKLWDSTLLFESLPSLYDIAGSAFFLVSSSREMKIENFHDHIESKKCIQFDCAI